MTMTDTDRQGRYVSDRRLTAVHEAGHAIAALYLGVHVLAGLAWNRSTGMVEHAGSDDPVEAIVISLAGYAAGEVLGVRGPGPEWPTARQLADDPGRDNVRAWRGAVALAGSAGAAELFGKCYAVALKLVALHWPGVLRIADLFESRDAALGHEIREVARVNYVH